MRNILIYSLLISSSLLSIAQAEPASEFPVGKQDAIMAILYQQHAGEYKALCYQAYNIARDVLDHDLSDTHLDNGLPRAVVVDVDETLLDNSPYEADPYMFPAVIYPQGWNEWVQQAKATTVPGSVDFLNYAYNQGVKVFYITNRSDAQKVATMANLRSAGFPEVSNETVLTQAPHEVGKNRRRAIVEKQYRITLLVGDSLSDFSNDYTAKLENDRNARVDQDREKFGHHFISLPNAIYGDWEGALYGNDWSGTPDSRAQTRRKLVKDFPLN